MSEERKATVTASAAIAKLIVDRLIEIASGSESEEWLAKYRGIQGALANEGFFEAVYEHSKLVPVQVQPKWVASDELTKKLRDAIGNLAYYLQLPNPGERKIELAGLPNHVTELGTIADEQERSLEEFIRSFRRDPLESDPDFAPVLQAASDLADQELAMQGRKRGLGYCHAFWQKKKQILKHRFGIEWQTPREMNPDIIFD